MPGRARFVVRLGGSATALACVVAAGAPGAPAAPRPTPERLWRAYPLEQQAAPPARASDRAGAAPATAGPAAGSSSPSPWTGILFGTGAAVFIVLVGASSRRRPPFRGGRRPDAADPPLDPRALAATVDPEPPKAAPPPARPAVPTAGSVVCQVRWQRDAHGSRFEAITVGGGRKRTVGVSPEFDWRGALPPDRSPDAQAALRALVEDLAEVGWAPVRGRGREAGAPRWYARRFCLDGPDGDAPPPPMNGTE
jgi:hypothetical protein